MAYTDIPFQKAAVLGAGTMGAQIAAHLANAGISTLLYDLPAAGSSKNAAAEAGRDALLLLKPPPLAAVSCLSLITPANYEDDLELLSDCTLVIEAVAEKADIKAALYRRITPYLPENAVLATNTSGLSVSALAETLPETQRTRFCGVHFFNPPRYMPLVELIPGKETAAETTDLLERFLVSGLGKSVIRAKDTPNFIGNRIGIFALLAGVYHAGRLGLPFDTADALTGPLLGRPKSATFRTIDVIGLDTFALVAGTSQTAAPDDPGKPFYTLPDWFHTLIGNKALGAKTGKGIYCKTAAGIAVFDPATSDYIPAVVTADPAVTEIFRHPDWNTRLERLRTSDNLQAQFVWAVLRDTFHYAALHAADIAFSARDIDFAMRWGFGWAQGPFEIWQQAGVHRVLRMMEEDLSAGKSPIKAPLPVLLSDIESFHNAAGSLDFGSGRYIARPSLDVYARQLTPPVLAGEPQPVFGTTVFENDNVRAFTPDNRILVLVNRHKMRTFSNAVLEDTCKAVDIAEKGFKALILWAPEAPFSVGADLKTLSADFKKRGSCAPDETIRLFQKTSLRLRTALIPTIAAVEGYALGGGCEIMMYCRRTVAALESRIGLVEKNVGLIPAGGGCTEMARRANGDTGKLTRYFGRIARAYVSGSAVEAREAGYLKADDRIVFNRYELLYSAIAEAEALMAAGNPTDTDTGITATGDADAMLEAVFGTADNRAAAGYDADIAAETARILTGAGREEGSVVDVHTLLDAEREAFVHLFANDKTQARITHILETGKPLAN